MTETSVPGGVQATDSAIVESPPTSTFASLAFPQFRLFWLSNLIVAMGLMVQTVAQRWLMVELTDSALLLGIVTGGWGLAFAVSSVPMGLAADRYNRRDLLAWGTVVALVIALSIGVLVLTDTIQVWHVMTAGIIGGVLYALRVPAGQAMTGRLVPPRYLMNAISLSQTSHSLPSIAGPAAGGLLVGLAGIAGAYFITSGTLILGLLLMLGVAAAYGSVQRKEQESMGSDLKEAIDYLRLHTDLLKLTAAMLVPFILGQSYVLLLPLFVEQELGLGPEAFGALSAAIGLGSVIGALAVARFGEQRQIGLLMLAGMVATGVAGIVYGLSESVYLVGLVLFAAGVGEAALFAAYDTLLLIRLPDEIRGRVMGLMFTLVAMFPLGAVVAGAAADVAGLRAVAVAEGVIVLALTAIAWPGVLRGVVAEAD